MSELYIVVERRQDQRDSQNYLPTNIAFFHVSALALNRTKLRVLGTSNS